MLTWIGGELPPTGPPGGELWDIQPTMTGHYTIKSAWPGATGEFLYCGGSKLNEERRHVLTWLGGELPPTSPPGGELWDIQPKWREMLGTDPATCRMTTEQIMEECDSYNPVHKCWPKLLEANGGSEENISKAVLTKV